LRRFVRVSVTVAVTPTVIASMSLSVTMTVGVASGAWIDRGREVQSLVHAAPGPPMRPRCR
jgi:hypothetical protein